MALIPLAAETIRMAPGGDLQKALAAAKPGDTLVLPAGAAFTGQFTLPKKAGSDFITLQTSGLDKLPAAGNRVGPADAVHMARIVSPNAMAAVLAAPGAHHYRFIGIEFTNKAGIYANNVIELGEVEAKRESDLPDTIEFDRVYLHGDPTAGGKRGILVNAKNVSIVNSYFSDFKSRDQDTQAILACNTPGPLRIVNNYLEASGENFMSGGCNNGIPSVTPSNIAISRNYFFKPLSWQAEKWNVKNLLELKTGRKVLIDGNILENNWEHGQVGFAVQITVRADGVDEHGKPFGVIEDVTFTNNIIRNSPFGINLLGADNLTKAGYTRNLVFRNNVFYGLKARLFQLASAVPNVTIDHNTGIGVNSVVQGENETSPGFVFTSNVVSHGAYGILFSDRSVGMGTIQACLPGAVIAGNIFIGARDDLYPKRNYFPETPEDVRFMDAAHLNLRLGPKSKFRGKGADQQDPGADLTVIEQLTANVVSGKQTG